MTRFARRRLLLALPILFPTLGAPAWANQPITHEFSPGVIEDALASGRTVVAAYHAFWCGVCRRQERVIKRLREDGTTYNRLYFVRVDWDEYRDLPIALDRSVFNRSTILVLKGGDEISRSTAATSVRALQEILDLAAATERGS